MAKKKKGRGRGWHGDSAEHAAAARKSGGKRKGPGATMRAKGIRVPKRIKKASHEKGLRKSTMLERMLGARKYS